MTPEAAIYQFLSGFDISAYPSSSTPDQADFPYLTYDLVISGGWDAGEVSMAVNVWYRTSSEAILNTKVRQISAAIGTGGVFLPCDGGVVWVKRGSPWAQSLSDESDNNIKRRYLNFDIEYIVPD